jgi:hypothetical protein
MSVRKDHDAVETERAKRRLQGRIGNRVNQLLSDRDGFVRSELDTAAEHERNRTGFIGCDVPCEIYATD